HCCSIPHEWDAVRYRTAPVTRPAVRIILRLLSLSGPPKKAVVIGIVSTLAATAFTLITPLLISWAIDYGIVRGKSDVRALGLVALAIFGAAVGTGISKYTFTYIGEATAQRIAYDLRDMLYNQLQRLSYAYHDHAQIGQIMSRVTQDVE